MAGFVVAGFGTPKVFATDFEHDFSKFDPGFIISDNKMYTKDMSKGDIEKFIAQHNANCQGEGRAGVQHEEPGLSAERSISAPCLKNYKVSYSDMDLNYCKPIVGANDVSVAYVIYKVQSACNISAKVLLVMLQKEQGFFSDPDPWTWQYQTALGYGCPDGKPCESDYYGIANQLVRAANQLNAYKLDEDFYWFEVGGMNDIDYSPDDSCGTKEVKIDDYATAALYYYTPFTPNKAALGTPLGEKDGGDDCSAYGNKNFWGYYNLWFGEKENR
ncbi:hypothetical protein FACS1894125_4200 [Actinomycetota bacterium]|nr:hypothetical protein FACS1894125_4200 [Actinomycetota bacterium]